VDAVARTQLDKASASSSGRRARTLYGGHERLLRQTVIALTAGTSLSGHANPGEATVFVLASQVRLATTTESCEGPKGDLLVVPQAWHALIALTDATVLVTVANHSQPQRRSRRWAVASNCPPS
jgi:quercetin dioxygenase-like cupin family protein